MISRFQNYVAFEELFSNSTEEFLKPFEEIVNPDINNGMELTFELTEKPRPEKISPILKLARPEDAKEIVDIYLDVYNGTYPYKEMEDENEVHKMIKSENYIFLLFKDDLDNTVGCFTYVLDFKKKRGYLRGFNLKKRYQGSIDAVKACVGSMVGIWSAFKDRICMWYAEARTAHSKSQYLAQVCGIKPVAFFPNKDYFLGEFESDVMHIIYNKKALYKYRKRETPKIVQEAIDCFLYSDKRYNLGSFIPEDPELNLNVEKIKRLKRRIKKSISRDRFGYEDITITLQNSDSYFKFFFTPQVNNFEKTKYKVKNLEELFVFVQHFRQYVRDLNIRYCECFVSAYKPAHQKIFLNAGLKPRGYVPSWKYNTKEGVFEDCIVFNYFEEKVSEKIKLIDEGTELLKALKEI